MSDARCLKSLPHRMLRNGISEMCAFGWKQNHRQKICGKEKYI